MSHRGPDAAVPTPPHSRTTFDHLPPTRTVPVCLRNAQIFTQEGASVMEADSCGAVLRMGLDD